MTEPLDNSGRQVTIYGSDAIDDQFVLTASGADARQRPASRSSPSRASQIVTLPTVDPLYTITITQAVRGEGDTVDVDAGDGNDILDASGLGLAVPDAGDRRPTRSHVTLIGGDGNDRLIGTPFDDILDSGLGNDTVTGGEGHDTVLRRGRHRHADRGLRHATSASSTTRSSSGQILGDGKIQVVTMTRRRSPPAPRCSASSTRRPAAPSSSSTTAGDERRSPSATSPTALRARSSAR